MASPRSRSILARDPATPAVEVEGLPTIDTELLDDGRRVRFFSEDPRRRAIRLLVESYGGSVLPLRLDWGAVAPASVQAQPSSR